MNAMDLSILRVGKVCRVEYTGSLYQTIVCFMLRQLVAACSTLYTEMPRKLKKNSKAEFLIKIFVFEKKTTIIYCSQALVCFIVRHLLRYLQRLLSANNELIFSVLSWQEPINERGCCPVPDRCQRELSCTSQVDFKNWICHKMSCRSLVETCIGIPFYGSFRTIQKVVLEYVDSRW